MSRDFTKNTVVVIPTSKPIVISHFLHAKHIFWVFRISAVNSEQRHYFEHFQNTLK